MKRRRIAHKLGISPRDLPPDFDARAAAAEVLAREYELPFTWFFLTPQAAVRMAADGAFQDAQRERLLRALRRRPDMFPENLPALLSPPAVDQSE